MDGRDEATERAFVRVDVLEADPFEVGTPDFVVDVEAVGNCGVLVCQHQYERDHDKPSVTSSTRGSPAQKRRMFSTTSCECRAMTSTVAPAICGVNTTLSILRNGSSALSGSW